MSFNTKKFVLIIITVVYVLLFLIFHKFLTNTLIGILILSLSLFAYFVFYLIFWRCPNCNRYLHKQSFFASYCPYCGNKLD